MGDYLSVIRRRKLLIAAMTLAGLALALFYSVAVAKPSVGIFITPRELFDMSRNSCPSFL